MDRSGSPLRSDGAIPLRTLAARSGVGAGAGSSMNRKTSRNNLLSANTRRKTASRNKLRDSDEEASQSLLRNSSNSFNNGRAEDGIGNGRGALTGEVEQEGDFDAGWKGDEDDNDEQALLEEGRILVCLQDILRVDGWLRESSNPPSNENRMEQPRLVHRVAPLLSRAKGKLAQVPERGSPELFHSMRQVHHRCSRQALQKTEPSLSPLRRQPQK